MKSIFLVIMLFVSVASFAQKSKIKELERQRKQALTEIANTDKLLRETKRSTSTLLDRIKLISKQISSRQRVLSFLNQELSSIDVEQKKIEDEILILEAELKEKQKNYTRAVEAMLANRRRDSKLLFVFSGKSLTESYRRFRYLKEYSEWRSGQADEIKDKSDKLKERKEALKKMKSEKLALASQRESEQANLVKEEHNYQEEVKEAQKKQVELQRLLLQKKKQADGLNQQISKLIAEEVARQERKAAAAAAAKAKATTTKPTRGGKKPTTTKPTRGAEKPTTSSPETAANTSAAAPDAASSANVTLSNNFSANKGKLPYPISGNYRITGRFGNHHHSQWQVTTSNNGIDIQSQAGAQAKAVFKGEVSKVIAFPGYNNCIIIRHGNYYTFYGNIQNVSVKQGDEVSTGQSLGSIYTDPDKGVSQMHFQLWKGTQKQNPEPWLR